MAFSANLPNSYEKSNNFIGFFPIPLHCEKRKEMSDHKLKTGKVEEKVVNAYRKIEDGVVNGYQAIEDAVVGAYQKIEDKFVEKFLDVEEEIVEIPEDGDNK